MILERDFSSVSEYLQLLRELAAITPGEDVWFRGHSNSTYELTPSLARITGGIEKEGVLSKRFKQNAFSYRQNPPQSEWEWLFLMQHFGVPTRLLDWTESPLIALYFAVNSENSANDSLDGDVWALLPAKYNFEVPRLRPELAVDIPCFGVDEHLNDYRPDLISRERASSKFPVAAIAHRQNERIVAQLGVFTITHRDLTPLNQIDPAKPFLARFSIPASAKQGLKTELAALRITQMTIFPELASVAKLAKELVK